MRKLVKSLFRKRRVLEKFISDVDTSGHARLNAHVNVHPNGVYTSDGEFAEGIAYTLELSIPTSGNTQRYYRELLLTRSAGELTPRSQIRDVGRTDRLAVRRVDELRKMLPGRVFTLTGAYGHQLDDEMQALLRRETADV